MSTKTLFRHSQNLSHVDIDDILHDIACNQEVEVLVLNNNRLGDEGVKKLVEGLMAYPQIKHLALSNNELTDKSCEYISNLTQLTHLDLSNNNITDNGLRWL